MERSVVGLDFPRGTAAAYVSFLVPTKGHPSMRTSLCLGLLLPIAFACGGSEGSPATSAAAGTWTGQWLSHDGIGGSATMTLSPSSDGLSGSISFTNSPCFASGAVNATLSGDSVSATVTAGAIEVNIDATLTGTEMSGTYDAVSAGACTGDTGTFSAKR
jgi:hypothetical protein